MDTNIESVDSTDLSSIIGRVVEFAPEEVKTDAELAVRAVGTSKKDKEKTERLAETILEVGQLQDAGAYPVVNEEGVIDYYIFMGNRRLSAIRHLNTLGKGEFKLRTRIFAPEEAKELKRKALIENVHRENYSPIALSHQIKSVREENGWEGKKNWSALVADYLKVSRAQVTQHMRLLDELEPEQLKMVEEKGWSAVAAFELLDTVPEKRDQVLVGAEEEARKEQEQKKKKKPEPVKADAKIDGKIDGKFGDTIIQVKDGKGKDAEEDATVKAKHVRKVSRELEANSSPKPLAKSEIIDFFREIAERPDFYGYANSPVRQFAAYFTTKYVAGLGKDKTLRDKFDAMVMDENGELFGGVGTASKAEIREREEQDAAAAEAEESKKKKKGK